MSKQIKLTRQELYEKVWQKPTIKLAEEFGMSDVGLAKICKKLNVPKPPLGYWRRIETGAKVKLTPLPKATDKTKDFIYLNIPTEDDIIKLSPEAQNIIDKEDSPENRIKLSADFADAHPLVLKTKQYFDKCYAKDIYPLDLPKGKDYLDLSVSDTEADRALLIFDALFKALENHDYKTKVINDSWGERTVVSKEGQKVEISLHEQSRKVQRELTEEEKKKPPYLLNIPEEFELTGKLSLRIKYHYSGYKIWNDRKDDPLENRLNDVLSMILVIVEHDIEEKRRRDEEERQRQEAIRRREEEKQNRERLEADALLWRKSQTIRVYLKAYEAKLIEIQGEIAVGSKDAEWLRWAHQYADTIDPLTKLIDK